MYILYTGGALGFCAYAIWGIGYLNTLRKVKNSLNYDNAFISGLPRLAIIIFVIFLFDQIKVEALRHYFLDYQHYLSALFGMFCGLDRIVARSYLQKSSKSRLELTNRKSHDFNDLDKNPSFPT